MSPDPLAAARTLAATGQDEAAQRAYLALLHDDPTNVTALIELAALAQATGHHAAAATAYRQATTLDPADPTPHTGLASLLREADPAAAETHYRAALAADPVFPPAHQGLGQLLAARGDPQAAHHLEAGFRNHALQPLRYRGQPPAIPLLLILAAAGGNVPTAPWIDDRRYAITALIADFHDPMHPLPPHALIVNAIGDADLCPAALIAAQALLATTTAPILNHPTHILPTGRQATATRLADLPHVIAPTIQAISRTDLPTLNARKFPFLLRSPGYHTGQNFHRIDTPADLPAANDLPGDEFWLIQYVDAAAPDGLFRKYRVMFIGGALYPLHMAASTHWKVHYFTAAMADRPDLRAEEARFLTDMPRTLGPRAMAALTAIQSRLALDYAGIDFALSPDGALILFEANATMVIVPPGPDPIWDYRRPAIAAATAAAAAMVAAMVNRADRAEPGPTDIAIHGRSVT